LFLNVKKRNKDTVKSLIGTIILNLLVIFWPTIFAFGHPVVVPFISRFRGDTNNASRNHLQLSGGNIHISRKVDPQRKSRNRRIQLSGGNIVEIFVKKVLFRNENSLCLTKSELEILILEETGLDISADMIDDMFHRIDVDGNGVISAHELCMYIQELEPTSTKKKRMFTVTKNVLKDVHWLMTIPFFTGTSINIASNVLARSGNSLQLGKFNPSSVSAWLFTIGTMKFTADYYQREFRLFELNETAKRELFKFIKIKIFRTQQQRVNFGKFSKGKIKLDRVDLKRILEGCAVFLPKKSFNYLYSKIDKDRNDFLTKTEIEVFLEDDQKKKLDRFQKMRIVSSKCICRWGFWSNCTWLVGSALFVATSYMPPLQGHFKIQFQQVGAFLYLIGGCTLLPILYEKRYGYYSAIEDLQCAIYALTVPNDSKLVNADKLRSVFQEMDIRANKINDDEGDGTLDCVECFNALQGAGIVIQLDTFMTVFRQADKSGDGRLSMEEFAFFVRGIDANEYRNKSHIQTLQSLLTNQDFWFSSLYVLAGALYTAESFGTTLGISGIARSNMLLCAGLCYAINSGRSLLNTPITALKQHKLKEVNKIKFQTGMLLRANEYYYSALPIAQ